MSNNNEKQKYTLSVNSSSTNILWQFCNLQILYQLLVFGVITNSFVLVIIFLYYSKYIISRYNSAVYNIL